MTASAGMMFGIERLVHMCVATPDVAEVSDTRKRVRSAVLLELEFGDCHLSDPHRKDFTILPSLSDRRIRSAFGEASVV
jgi:hypothetical protein